MLCKLDTLIMFTCLSPLVITSAVAQRDCSVQHTHTRSMYYMYGLCSPYAIRPDAMSTCPTTSYSECRNSISHSISTHTQWLLDTYHPTPTHHTRTHHPPPTHPHTHITMCFTYVHTQHMPHVSTADAISSARHYPGISPG